MNLVIAILMDIYSNFSSNQRGLYYDTILQLIPILKYDKNYGALVCAYSPFGVIPLILSPLYYFFKEDSA